MTKPASSAREQVSASSPVLPIPAAPLDQNQPPRPCLRSSHTRGQFGQLRLALQQRQRLADVDRPLSTSLTDVSALPTLYRERRNIRELGRKSPGPSPTRATAARSETGPDGIPDAFRHLPRPRPRRDPDRRVHHHRTRATAPIPRLARAQLRNRRAPSRGPRDTQARASATARSVAFDSMRRLFPNLACRRRPDAPLGRARARGGRHGDVRHRAAVAWLAQRTQPRWMLLGAWTCAGWSAVAVPALAITRHIRVLAWWGLGLLAILVLLTFIWTEQPSSRGPDDGDQPHPGGPPEPPQGARPHKGRHQGRSHVLEQRTTPLGHSSPPHRKR